MMIYTIVLKIIRMTWILQTDMLTGYEYMRLGLGLNFLKDQPSTFFNLNYQFPKVTFRPPTKQSCLAAVEDRMMVILLGLSAYVYKFS